MTESRSKRPFVIALLASLGVLVLGGGAYALIVILPWLRGPNENSSAIDARWAKVESWARVATQPADLAPSELASVAITFRSFTKGHAGWQPSAAEQQALARLERWAQAGAPLPDRSCAPEVPPGGLAIHLFKAGQAAIASARDEQALPRVRAVSTLGQRLRTRGSLLDLAVGAELAVRAAEWHDQHALTSDPVLMRTRPRAEEIHATLAREAVCIIQRVNDEAGLGEVDPRSRPPFGLVRIERERQVFKHFHGRLLEELHPKRHDWREILRVYTEAHDARPKSLLLDVSMLMPNVIQSTGEKLDRFDTLVPR